MIIRLAAFFGLFLSLIFNVYGKERPYFDFSFSRDTLSTKGEVDTNFIYNFSEGVSEERFKIKPRLKSGTAEILENDKWVGGNSLWTESANLAENKKLKVKGNFYKTDVWFEVLDLKTGEIYKTPKHFVLSRNWFEDYIKNLNEVIFEFATMVE